VYLSTFITEDSTMPNWWTVTIRPALFHLDAKQFLAGMPILLLTFNF